MISVAITAMALGGCTVAPVPTTTYSSAPTQSSPTTPGPVKYAAATFRTCPEIRQKVPGLPPPLKAEPVQGSGEFGLTCTFTTQENDSEPMITFDVALYENWQNSSGTERGKLAFANSAMTGAQKETGVGVGSEARWADPGVGPSCRLEVLDANVVMMTRYSNGGTKLDPRGERCRELARDVVKQLYDAIQP